MAWLGDQPAGERGAGGPGWPRRAAVGGAVLARRRQQPSLALLWGMSLALASLGLMTAGAVLYVRDLGQMRSFLRLASTHVSHAPCRAASSSGPFYQSRKWSGGGEIGLDRAQRLHRADGGEGRRTAFGG